jgi:hypothetical protein
MTEFAPARIAASLNRALWGEVSGRLRVVRFRTTGTHINLRFYLDGEADEDERDSIGCVGG